MDIDPQFVKQAAPGAIGSIGALWFVNGGFFTRAGAVFVGSTLSWYGAPHIAKSVGMPEGLAGFLLGLCGMAFIAKAFDTWTAFDVGSLLKRTAEKLLGLKK